MLERQGLLDRIDLGEGRARFEVREDHREHILLQELWWRG
jgi:Fe2+ or Zn2+ uptake regulation protein